MKRRFPPRSVATILPALLLLAVSFASNAQQQSQNPVSKAVTRSVVDVISGPAVTDLKPAAERGDAVAQHKLGRAYYLRGDHTNAVHWYRKAALQGLAEAQYDYGNTFLGHYPPKVPKDSKEAVRWISLAAHQNHSAAQLALAQHLEKGTVGKPDKVEAMKWLTILVNNRPEYRVYENNLALKLSTEEIAEAKRRAQSFRASASREVRPIFKLQGISGSGERKLALVNGQTFAANEKATVKVDGNSYEVHCIEIGSDFVTIKVKGDSIPHLLRL